MAASLPCARGSLSISSGLRLPSVSKAEPPASLPRASAALRRSFALSGSTCSPISAHRRRASIAGRSRRRAVCCQQPHGDRWEAPSGQHDVLRSRAQPAVQEDTASQPGTQHSSSSWQALPRQAASMLATAVSAVFSLLRKPAVAALLLALLVVGTPGLASAASGGRMGGSSFSKSGRSGGGGGGGGGGYSRSYSAPRSSGYSGPSFSAPYYGPSLSPYSPLGGFGGGFGSYPSRGVYVSPGVSVGAGGGFLNVLFFGMAGVFVWNLISTFLTDRAEGGLLGATTTTSVVRVQVGLLGLARTFQKDLDRIADRADTGTPEGLHFMLTETVLALLRHPDMVVYGHSTQSDVKKSAEEGERAFNAASFEERSKFDQETLSNVGNVRRRVSRALKAERFNNEYIVVTVLVAAEGKVQLPAINSMADLRAALSKLGSLTSDQVQAVEILWTPQDEDDTLTEQEVLRDYPRLRSI